MTVASALSEKSVYTLDSDELTELVRGSLTRGFSQGECDRWGFDDDRPTLEDMSRRRTRDELGERHKCSGRSWRPHETFVGDGRPLTTTLNVVV